MNRPPRSGSPVSHVPPRITTGPIPSAGALRKRGVDSSPPRRGPTDRWLLFGLFVLVLAFVVYFARPILMPLVAALFLSILFVPIARRLRRLGAPAPLAAAMVIAFLSVLLTASAISLGESLGEWIDNAPETIEQLERKLVTLKEPVESVKKATENLEEIAESDPDFGVQKVEVRPPSLAGVILSQSMSMLGSLALCLALTFLLLCSGDQLVANTIRVAATFGQRRRMLRAIRSLEREMSRYLALRTAVNAGLGLAAYVVFVLLGLPDPVLWAATTAILNYIPYVGATVACVLVGIVSVVHFDSLVHAALPPTAVIALNILEGFVITPLVLARWLHLHPVMIFLATVIWGWMWGITGAFLAVPILAAIVIVFRHFPPLQPIAQFLGGDRVVAAPPPEPALRPVLTAPMPVAPGPPVPIAAAR